MKTLALSVTVFVMALGFGLFEAASVLFPPPSFMW